MIVCVGQRLMGNALDRFGRPVMSGGVYGLLHRSVLAIAEPR